MNNSQECDQIAVLGLGPIVQAQIFSLLAELGLRPVAFDKPAKLSAALVQGHRFGMLVLFFKTGGELARVTLEHLAECAGPEVPVMLLMSSDQVELASSVMDSDRSDFLLAPYTADELGARLTQLYWHWRAQEEAGLMHTSGAILSVHGGAEQPVRL